MIPLEHVLFFSAALFGAGLLGLTMQKSMLRILLAVEAMLNGAAFGFIGTAIHFKSIDGHVMFFMVLAIAAAEVGIALSILLHCDNLFKTLDVSGITAASKE